MSWSMSVPPTDAADFLQALEDATPNGFGIAEEANAAEFCRDAARSLFSNGRLGTPAAGVLYQFTASGHTTQGHNIMQGETPELIMFSMTRSIPTPVPDVLAVTDTPAAVYHAIAGVDEIPQDEAPAVAEDVTEPAADVTSAPDPVTEEAAAGTEAPAPAEETADMSPDMSPAEPEAAADPDPGPDPAEVSTGDGEAVS